jgi:hypothetical protein
MTLETRRITVRGSSKLVARNLSAITPNIKVVQGQPGRPSRKRAKAQPAGSVN